MNLKGTLTRLFMKISSMINMKICRSKCIKRAGHLFMLTAWLESMMIKSILLNEGSQTAENFAISLAKHNEVKSFGKTFQMFKEAFSSQLTSEDIELFEEYYVLRDMFAHLLFFSTIPFFEQVIQCPNVDSREKKKAVLKRLLSGKELGDDIVSFTFKRKEYNRYLVGFEKIDKEIFPKIFENLSFKTEESEYKLVYRMIR
ncbi:MAG: hypothetical protein ACRCZE_03005 [Candidatus Altimarinota bacterium]